MRRSSYISSIILIAIVLVVIVLNVLAHCCVLRYDMTEDKRYTISETTKHLVRSLDEPMIMTLYLDGQLNAGFMRLRKATLELGEDIHACQSLFAVQTAKPDSTLIRYGLSPTLVHERSQDGRTIQTQVFPYVSLTYHGRTTYVPLLHNNRGKMGEQNLNESIEDLEYAMAESIYLLTRQQTQKIAFIEGHNELPERSVYDISATLSRYFQIDRGVIGNDPTMLNDYRVVIIADPQTPFSETDKYVLDQYIMRGGRVLWLINGVRFSKENLSSNGYTPVIPLDLHLADMLFTYGIRINPTLVQDVQCLPIPVDVSADPSQPNYQPLPWYYAPLLLTSQQSPITRNVGQVSATFVSHVDAVGNDSIQKEILLATSTASRVIGTPTEVDLGDINPDMSLFQWQFVPVSVALSGSFTSAFHHRMPPEGMSAHEQQSHSVPTKQIVVASGSVIRNEWQQGPLPVGYDRYSGMVFGNRDFLTNAVLYLADDDGLIMLRQKSIALRLLNDRRAHEKRYIIQVVSIISPIALLALTGCFVMLIRKRKYIRL